MSIIIGEPLRHATVAFSRNRSAGIPLKLGEEGRGCGPYREPYSTYRALMNNVWRSK